jgi:hypothetical protein
MRYVLLILLIVSCATKRDTIRFSAIGGAIAGGMAGSALSPNDESKEANALVFGLLGGVVAAYIGNEIYEDDPRNSKRESLIFDEKYKDDEINKSSADMRLGDLGVNLNAQPVEEYELPKSELPENLRDVLKPKSFKFKTQKTYFEKNGKTYVVPEFEYYEVFMEKEQVNEQ